MKLSSRKIEKEGKIELSMTSMIDVVFLLLLFFLLTSSFMRTERDLPSAIKVNEKSAKQVPSDLEPAIIDVVQGSGRFVYKLGAREFSSDVELTGILRQFPNKADGAIVRVSDAAPFGMAAAAIQACKTANFVTVSYVPLKK